MAGQIAEASCFVLAIGKQGFYAQVDQMDDKATHYAKHAITLNMEAENARNGIKAFLEKKHPEWKNL